MAQVQYAIIKWITDGNVVSVHHLKNMREPTKPWSEYKAGDIGKCVYPGKKGPDGDGLWACKIISVHASRKVLESDMEGYVKRKEIAAASNGGEILHDVGNHGNQETDSVASIEDGSIIPSVTATPIKIEMVQEKKNRQDPHTPAQSSIEDGSIIPSVTPTPIKIETVQEKKNRQDPQTPGQSSIEDGSIPSVTCTPTPIKKTVGQEKKKRKLPQEPASTTNSQSAKKKKTQKLDVEKAAERQELHEMEMRSSDCGVKDADVANETTNGDVSGIIKRSLDMVADHGENGGNKENLAEQTEIETASVPQQMDRIERQLSAIWSNINRLNCATGSWPQQQNIQSPPNPQQEYQPQYMPLHVQSPRQQQQYVPNIQSPPNPQQEYQPEYMQLLPRQQQQPTMESLQTSPNIQSPPNPQQEYQPECNMQQSPRQQQQPTMQSLQTSPNVQDSTCNPGGPSGSATCSYTKQQLTSIVANMGSDWGKASKKLFRQIYRPHEYAGRTLTGAISNTKAKDKRPAMEDQSRLQIIYEVIRGRWPFVSVSQIRQKLAEILKPSRN